MEKGSSGGLVLFSLFLSSFLPLRVNRTQQGPLRVSLVGDGCERMFGARRF